MPASRDEPTPAAQAHAEKQSLVVVAVGEVELALPARAVSAVSGVDTPTPIPGAPGHILGLVATGDRVLPLVDLAAFLDLSAIGGDPMFRRALITRVGALEAGLVCERARGMLTVERSALKPPAVLQGERLQAFLVAEIDRTDRVIGVLDPTALLEAAAVQ